MTRVYINLGTKILVEYNKSWKCLIIDCGAYWLRYSNYHKQYAQAMYDNHGYFTFWKWITRDEFITKMKLVLTNKTRKLK